MVRYFIVFLTFVGAVFSQSSLAEPKIQLDRPILVGISSGAHYNNFLKHFEKTKESLKNYFGENNIKFTPPLPIVELVPLIKEKKVDFFISTSGLSRLMANEGTRDLLTFTTPRFPDSLHSFGGVFLVRKDSGIKKISDLKGRRYATNREGGFYGHITVMGELEKRNLNHENFFKKVEFLNKKTGDVVQYLMDGKTDVISLPSCYWEDAYPPGSKEREELVPVEPKVEKPCARSTDGYTNWAISSLKSTPTEWANEVCKVLLGMDHDEGFGWSIATDPSQTDELFKSLRIGPYEGLRKWSFRTLLNEYKHWIILSVAIFVLLVIYSFVLNKMVYRRTKLLSQSLNEQINLARKKREAESKFSRLQRITLISQMSSMVAHELGQPLNAIIAYAHGLTKFIEQEKLPKDVAVETLRKISELAKRSAQIVERVRTYAKDQVPKKTELDLASVLQEAIQNFKAGNQYEGKLHVDIEAHPKIIGDVLSLELAFSNLLKNAAEALSRINKRKQILSVTLVGQQKYIEITISDNSGMLTQAMLDEMKKPLSSQKQAGMGLGLTITQSIINEHGGTLCLSVNAENGLTAKIKFSVSQ